MAESAPRDRMVTYSGPGERSDRCHGADQYEIGQVLTRRHRAWRLQPVLVCTQLVRDQMPGLQAETRMNRHPIRHATSPTPTASVLPGSDGSSRASRSVNGRCAAMADASRWFVAWQSALRGQRAAQICNGGHCEAILTVSTAMVNVEQGRPSLRRHNRSTAAASA